MKVFLTKLNDLQRTLFFGLVTGIVFILFSLIGLFFKQPGWIIGVSLGTLASLINVALLFKGSDIMLKQVKPMLFLLLFFARMIVIAVTFIFCVLMQFQFHIPAFTNSIWGALIGFAPGVVIVIVSLVKQKPIEVKG